MGTLETKLGIDIYNQGQAVNDALSLFEDKLVADINGDLAALETALKSDMGTLETKLGIDIYNQGQAVNDSLAALETSMRTEFDEKIKNVEQELIEYIDQHISEGSGGSGGECINVCNGVKFSGDMMNERIVNLGNAINSTDAVNKRGLDKHLIIIYTILGISFMTLFIVVLKKKNKTYK